MLPNRHKLNTAALVVSFILMVIFVRSDSTGTRVLCLLVMTAIALAFGWHRGLYRRCGHAGGGLDAQLLLGLGGSGGGLYAE